MIVVRKINEKEIAVDINKPSSILFHKEDIDKYGINLEKNSLNDIEKLLKADSEVVPFELTWEITNRCNLNCPFCYIHNHVYYNDVSFETAKPYLDEMISSGLIRATLTGGECTLNKDFERIYRYLKENGVLVDVYTNGILLNNNIFTLFDEYPPNRVEMTIYDSINNQPKPYENALKLKNNNINVLVKFTVTTTTLQYFEEVRDWCSTNGFSFKFDTDISDAFDESHTSKYQIELSEKVRLDRIKANNKSSKKDMTCFSCGAGNVSYHINSNFELGLCCRDKDRYPLIGSSFVDRYSEMKRKILKFKHQPYEGCSMCFAKPICRMCFLRAIKAESPGGTVILKAPEKFCIDTQKYYKCLFAEKE